MALMNLKPAYAKAMKEFSRNTPEVMANNALVDFDQSGSFFVVPFLGGKYRVYYPGGNIECCAGDGEVKIDYKVVLLHYLTHCSPRDVENAKVSFKELPSGSIYVGPFTNRAIKPLVSIFAGNIEKMLEAAERLGGWKDSIGDVSVTVPVLPKIPITFVIWEGDDEFPPTGNVLFDTSAPSHLDTEDYALLPGLALWEMKRVAQI
ncbi:DUF3786 domain-containing protein [Desulfoscipio sp. XC116]|uniref:DUF3786 domain-containing protein n=1 Tax=Desulfoscipio sp. XC116 TaxID=3144975 RepID=UPI00325BDC14